MATLKKEHHGLRHPPMVSQQIFPSSERIKAPNRRCPPPQAARRGWTAHGAPSRPRPRRLRSCDFGDYVATGNWLFNEVYVGAIPICITHTCIYVYMLQ